jgi:hypothetical protein
MIKTRWLSVVFKTLASWTSLCRNPRLKHSSACHRFHYFAEQKNEHKRCGVWVRQDAVSDPADFGNESEERSSGHKQANTVF